jgi:hypothetical protein
MALKQSKAVAGAVAHDARTTSASAVTEGELGRWERGEGEASRARGQGRLGHLCGGDRAVRGTEDNDAAAMGEAGAGTPRARGR